MSIRKYAPYQKEARWDSKRVERLKEFKNKISEKMTVSGIGEANDAGGKPTKKRKGKKERLKSKGAVTEEDPNIAAKVPNPPAELGDPDTLKRRREYEDEDDVVGHVQEPETHGKKKRRRRKTEPRATEV